MLYKTLYILRHAKTHPALPAEDDSTRKLTARGERDAGILGEYMSRHGIRPELVMCSTAARTRQTLMILQQGMGTLLNTQLSAKLYLASPKEILQQLSGVPDSVGSVMIIAHNPSLHQLAHDLAGSGDPAELQELSEHYPTCTLSEIEYPAEHWSEFGARKGVLKRYVIPKRLVEAQAG